MAAKRKKRILELNEETLGFTPSEYQKKFFDFVLHGTGNAVIEATAGSGKTTTCVASMKLIPSDQRCLFLAFNRSIADELGKKLSDYKNCVAKTGHGLGYAIVRQNLGNCELDEYKYRTYLKKNLPNLVTQPLPDMSRKKLEEYIDNTTLLINLGRLAVAQTKEDLIKLSETFNIEIEYDECEVALACMAWGRSNTETIDYTDMLWLPITLDLPSRMQYDWVYLDEAQDASLLMVQLFMKCFKRGTRFVAVGDKAQSINQFAGASKDAFDMLCDMPNTTKFDLPISYRCATHIVDLAKQYSPRMQPRPQADQGSVRENVGTYLMHDGDMVLARTKAPLITLYNRLLDKNVNCYIKGSDIGANWKRLVEAVDKTKLSTDLLEDGIFPRLYDKMFTERNKLMARYGLDIIDASLSASIMERYDTIQSLYILAKRLTSKRDLINRISKIFKDEGNGICLSTVHKAKGLEADNVFILCHSTMPSKRAKKQWEIDQERNIIYVAYTRAKHNLYMVNEKEIPPAGSQVDPMQIINDLKLIEEKICKALNKEPTSYETGNIDLARFAVQQAEKIADPTETLNDTEIAISHYNSMTTSKRDALLNELDSLIDTL